MNDWFEFNDGVMARWVDDVCYPGAEILQLRYDHPWGLILGETFMFSKDQRAEGFERRSLIDIVKDVYDTANLTNPSPSLFHWGPEPGDPEVLLMFHVKHRHKIGFKGVPPNDYL